MKKRKGLRNKYFSGLLALTMLLGPSAAYAQDHAQVDASVITEAQLMNAAFEAQMASAATDAQLTNVALKGIASVNKGGSPDRPAGMLNDGIVGTNSNVNYAETGRDMAQTKLDPYYVQIDLSKNYELEKLNLWRYFNDNRSYKDTIIFISEDTNFTAEDIVYSADESDFFGFGAGTDKAYAEIAAGKEITFSNPITGRYIRVINNGHDMGGKKGGHYVELQAWAKAEPTNPTTKLPFPNAEQPLDLGDIFTANGKQKGETHPDVLYFKDGWNGYKYWMATTPNQSGNSQFENPALLASNDNVTWVAPNGISNPLTGVKEEPRPYHNCDAELVYNPENDSLYFYYNWAKDDPGYGGNGFAPSEIRLFIISKGENGASIVTPQYQTVIKTTYRYDALSPSVIRGEDGIWKMWTVNTGDRGYNNQSNRIDYRLSKDGIHWSEPVSLADTFDLANYQIWHMNVQYIPEKNEYWAIFPAYPDGGSSAQTYLFFAKSNDGKVWTTYDKKVMDVAPGKWDSSFIYRSSLIYDAATDKVRVWYSGGTNGVQNGWRTGYTENTFANLSLYLGQGSTPTVAPPTDPIIPDVGPGVEASWHDVDALGKDIVYDEGWGNLDSEGIAISSTKGAKATLTFYGTGIRWIGQKDVNFGIGEVWLDGVKVATVDTYGRGADATFNKLHYENTNLTEGVHTISIVPTGTKNLSSSDRIIDIDKLVVKYSDSAVIGVNDFTVTPTTAEMYKDESIQVIANVQPYNANNKSLTWLSSNSSVASVSNTGLVSAFTAGEAVITAALTGTDITRTVKVNVKEYPAGVPLRMTINNENPLFLHHLYRQVNSNLPGPLQGGKSIQGFWDSIVNGDINGNRIREDLVDNQVIIVHASGSVKGNASTLAWYEDRFVETLNNTPNDSSDDIPFFIMVSNSGTSDGGEYTPPSIEWTREMYEQYPNMRGVLFSENHNATAGWQRTARSEYMKQQVLLAAEQGGYVVYSDMNDNSDYVESVLDHAGLFNTLQEFKQNFILLAKTTSAWSNVSYNSHESVAQGAWMADIAGNWGSLIDSWMWFIEGFGPLHGDETFGVMGGAEECRGPFTFPELLAPMRMIQQARVGATVFSYEHPDHMTSIATNNGANNQFTPVFTEAIAKAMEYMEDYDIPTKDEVIAKTKFAYSAEKGTLDSLSRTATGNLLNPLYGDKNNNGYNNTTMMTYFTGRYGTIPSLPKRTGEEVKAKFQYVYDKDQVVSNLKNQAGIKAFFNELYPETYEGTAYAHEMNSTWFLYNHNWNIDSRVDAELDATQFANVSLSNNSVKANVEFAPYTYVMIDDQKQGELSFNFNNYLVDKNDVWDGYIPGNGRPGDGSTWHWDSDNDRQFYDYVLDHYIPDAVRNDDRYRAATITLTGFIEEPTLEIKQGLTNDDGSHQYAEPVTTWDAETGTFTIQISANGWVDFAVKSDDSVPSNSLSGALSGAKEVQLGNEVSLTYGLKNVTDAIYAKDVTFDYDPALLELVSYSSLFENFKIVDAVESLGKLRIIAAGLGSEGGISKDSDVLQLNFTAKALTEADGTAVQAKNGIVSNADGEETALANTDLNIVIKDTPPVTNPEDVNGDNKISIGDLAMIAAAYGKTSSDPDWAKYAKLDIVRDGTIDIQDLAAVASKILAAN